MGEQGPELLRAVSEAYECGRQVQSLLTSFSNVKQALAPPMMIFAHIDKPAVQEFIAEMRCALELASLKGHLPAAYLETELKMRARA